MAVYTRRVPGCAGVGGAVGHWENGGWKGKKNMSGFRSRRRFVCEGLESRTLLTAIVSNTTTPGSISARAEVDSYEFDAAAGERIILSLGEVTPTYEPFIELRGPAGELIDSAQGNTGALVDAVAPVAGTYSAREFEYANDETGDYLLHFVKLPNPGAAAPDPFDGDGGLLASNTTTAASVDTPGDFDVYFVDAVAGERMVLSLAEVTPAYEPFLALYGPGGAPITTASGSFSAYIESVAPTTGTYAVLAFEFGNDEVGDYLLHFAKLPHTGTTANAFDGDGGVLASNTTTAASIDAAGDFDLYTFNATAGERVVLSLAEVTPAYEPFMALYGPGGALIDSAQGNFAAFLEAAVPSTGTYTVLTLEYGNDEAGDYRLHFMRMPHAGPDVDPFDGDGATLVSNTTTAASMDALGDLDLYSFQATAGERIILSLGEVTPAYEPYMELYGPGGALLDTKFGNFSALIEVVAPSTGTYNVLIAEYGDDEPGDYHLNYAKVPHAGPALDPFDGDGTVLTGSSTTNAAIQGPGDFDLYSIPAVAGEILSLSVTEGAATPAYEPYIELYGPGGNLIGTNQGSVSAALQTTAAATGTYTFLVFEYGADEAGDYLLQLARKAGVTGRMVFYNNSAFDGAGDDNAIAQDKSARMPGQVGSFANIIGFTKGINGVMADVAVIPGQTLSPSDFTFKAGTEANPANWAAAPAPQSVTVRKGAGVNGSDRIVLVWSDNSIRNQWLQVTLLANATTNLAAPSVFYFGNLVGDTGDSPLRVNALDLGVVKAALNRTAPIDGKQDVNHDGRVNALDLGAIKANLNRVLVAVAGAATADAMPAAFGDSGVAPGASNLSDGESVRRVWDEAPVGPLP